MEELEVKDRQRVSVTLPIEQIKTLKKIKSRGITVSGIVERSLEIYFTIHAESIKKGRWDEFIGKYAMGR